MCTAISIGGGSAWFGRTLDAERDYGEAAIILPRRFPLTFQHEKSIREHPAIIGIGVEHPAIPLFFDAANEFGLAGAGLRFSHSARYHSPQDGMHNTASFELILWVLAGCRTLKEAKGLISQTVITPESISAELPAEPLHWIFADSTGAITVESTESGLSVTENLFGVLTNEPAFPFQISHAAMYRHLTPDTPENRLCPSVSMTPFTGGMGAVGLPGDFTSPSRFVRAIFVREHAGPWVETADDFFRITDAVSVPQGCMRNPDGGLTCTRWTSCYRLRDGVLSFTSASDRQNRGFCLDMIDPDSEQLAAKPLGMGER